MLPHKWKTFFATVIVFAAGQVTAHSPMVNTIKKVRPSVVAIGTFNPTGNPRQVFRGTGFVVGNGHQVITNFHVLPKSLNKKRKEEIAVFSGRGKKTRYHKAKVLAKDPHHDLALLYISEPLPALSLAKSGSEREGQEIAFTGFPIGMVLGLYPVSHRGMISAISPAAQPQISSRALSSKVLRTMRNPFNTLQLDATAYPGNSGSAVYDQQTGKVVGVLNSVLIKKTKETVIQKPSGISYAIPVRHVHELMRKARP